MTEKILSDMTSIETMKKNGNELFDFLFGIRNRKKVMRYLKDTRFFRIDVDDTTSSIPFELLYINDDFLSMKKLCYRHLIGARELNGRSLNIPFKMIIIANPVSNRRPNLEWVNRERQELQNLLIPLQREGKIQLDAITERISSTDLVHILNKYDIVHFAGHVCHGDNGDETGWDLGREIFSRKELQADNFEAMPAIIFANACHSGTVSFEAEELARKFIRFGVSNYIGTLCDIPDSAETVNFVRTFYDALLGSSAGEIGQVNPVAVALYHARKSTRTQSPHTTHHGLNYMLYADPGFRFPKKNL